MRKTTCSVQIYKQDFCVYCTDGMLLAGCISQACFANSCQKIITITRCTPASVMSLAPARKQPPTVTTTPNLAAYMTFLNVFGRK